MIPLIVLIFIAAAVGSCYYLTIYVPQYNAERSRLLTLVVVAEDPLDMDPALAID